MLRGSLKVVWEVMSSLRGFGGMGRGARAPLYGVVSLGSEENVLMVFEVGVSGSEMEVTAWVRRWNAHVDSEILFIFSRLWRRWCTGCSLAMLSIVSGSPRTEWSCFSCVVSVH